MGCWKIKKTWFGFNIWDGKKYNAAETSNSFCNVTKTIFNISAEKESNKKEILQKERKNLSKNQKFIQQL